MFRQGFSIPGTNAATSFTASVENTQLRGVPRASLYPTDAQCLYTSVFASIGRLAAGYLAGGFQPPENVSGSESGEEIGQRGKALYNAAIRQKVESPVNIGKMVVNEMEIGDYEVDELGLGSSCRLHAKRLDAPLYGIRNGYNVAESLGGVMERVEA